MTRSEKRGYSDYFAVEKRDECLSDQRIACGSCRGTLGSCNVERRRMAKLSES